MSRKRKHRKPRDAKVTAETVEEVAAEEVAAEEVAAEVTIAAIAEDGAELVVTEVTVDEGGGTEVVITDVAIDEGEAVVVDVIVPDPMVAADAASDELAGDLGDGLAAELPTSAAAMDALQLKYLIEALIFASDKPVTLARLRQLTRVSEMRRIEHAVDSLAEDYRERGLVLQQVSGGYQFRTRTQFSLWVQQLIAGRPVRLSRAQLETLAIIAYRQPITRPEIDDIRGVDSSATLKLLLDRALIRILGKKEEAGRPMLYGTTKEFLDFFSLGDLRELPTLREYSELTDESRRRMGELGVEPPDAPATDDALAADLEIVPDEVVAADVPAADAPAAPMDDGVAPGTVDFSGGAGFAVASVDADEGFTAGSVDLDAVGAMSAEGQADAELAMPPAAESNDAEHAGHTDDVPRDPSSET